MLLGKYSRQMLFQPIGAEGQQKLLASKTVIVGCGALGTAQANALVRAGVGVLRIIDRDYVEESNLQRQALFDEGDAAQRLPKAVAAERKLRAINSDVRVEGVVADLDSRNAEDLLRGFDLILDGTDNFETRYLMNDAAVKLGIPWIYGAVVGSYGSTMTILPAKTACLRCVFPNPPQGPHESCDTAGVIGPAVAWVAAIQTAEAMKLLLGRTNELHQSLQSFDVWTNRLERIHPRLNPDCPACGQHDLAFLRDAVPHYARLCGRDAVQVRPPHPVKLNLGQLRRRLERLGSVRGNDFLLNCALDPYELTIFSDGRAIVKGTGDPAVARGVYAKYVGS
jgi:molybdopterin/thiamine biosynthesis adenylyltransferase